MSPVASLAVILTDFTPAPGLPSPRPGLDPDKVTPGLIGLVWFLVMAVALVFLVRNMIGRIKRVPKDLNVAIPRAGADQGPVQTPVQTPAEGTVERESP